MSSFQLRTLNTTPRRTYWRSILYSTCALLLLCGCNGAGLDSSQSDRKASTALAPATSGQLAEIATRIQDEHGAEFSGFRLLDSSLAGLNWRLAMIDSATTSLDIQTYLWYPDHSGRLILERAILAAERGVRVRLLVDDLILQGHDQLIANLNAAKNIEFGLFNPWEERQSLANRVGEVLAKRERLNTRMHDKLLIVDGRAVIIGGRNIGDHYFGLSDTYNFHDTDLLGIGEIGQQANAMFDEFWGSEWVVSADALSTKPDQALARQQRENLKDRVATDPALSGFSRTARSWSTELADLEKTLRIGRSKLVYDEAAQEQILQSMGATMFNFLDIAKEELMIQNAYIIPSDKSMEFVRRKIGEGVSIRVLTNSLSSHDVPAVNSHYEPWRDDLLKAGVDLWEFRNDPAIQRTVIDTPPVTAKYSGLHSKCAVADRRYVFVGSMNMDPRSWHINTEMGAMVDSPALAEDLARVLERNMSGENAWHVSLGDDGNIYWENSEEKVDQQPARDSLQRVMNVLMKLGPRDQY